MRFPIKFNQFQSEETHNLTTIDDTQRTLGEFIAGVEFCLCFCCCCRGGVSKTNESRTKLENKEKNSSPHQTTT